MTTTTPNPVEGMPIADPDHMVEIVRKHFPDIPGWHAHFSEVVSTLLDVKDRGLIGHEKFADPSCSLKHMGHGASCDKNADFVLVTVLLELTSAGIGMKSCRVRYYCTACMYSTTCRALTSVSSPAALDQHIEDGLVEAQAKILDWKTSFLEHVIGRTGERLQEVYGEQADDIVRELDAKFAPKDE